MLLVSLDKLLKVPPTMIDEAPLYLKSPSSIQKQDLFMKPFTFWVDYLSLN